MEKLINLIEEIDLTKVDGDKIVITPEAEEQIDKLLMAEKLIADMKNRLKERFIKIAKQNPKLKRYEGSKVQVGYMAKRTKKIVGDPAEEYVIVDKKPNTKAIDAYYNLTGELPTGIEEKVFEYITFKQL